MLAPELAKWIVPLPIGSVERDDTSRLFSSRHETTCDLEFGDGHFTGDQHKTVSLNSLYPDGLCLRGTSSPKRPQSSDRLVTSLLVGLGVVVKVHSSAFVPAQLVQGILSSRCSIFPLLSIHLLVLGRKTWLGECLGANGPWREWEVFFELEFTSKYFGNGNGDIHLVLP